ncbi:MAG: hypothetical protein MMC33_003039 [Icmadophila ericetorum]|nr:hypothetical protein [Icmadophila ericetorum]
MTTGDTSISAAGEESESLIANRRFHEARNIITSQAQDSKGTIDAKWRSSLQARKTSLRTFSLKDLKDVEHTKSSEALIELLQDNFKRLSGAQTWLVDYLITILPSIKVLEETSKLFLAAMYPYTPPLEFLWGVLGVVILLSQKGQKNWQDFVATFDDICQHLEDVNDNARWIWKDGQDSEGLERLSKDISRIFVILINFWISVIELNRTNPYFSNDYWPSLKKRSEQALDKIKSTVAHISGLVTPKYYAKPNELRNELLDALPSIEETVDFPLKVLPYPAYRGFFGRRELLTSLDDKLGLAEFNNRSPDDLRSVLIHGLGGVGKTQTLLAYAHRNPSGFDAIFWIRSDTEVNLKASFTEVAMALNLPGAKREGHDEENLLYFHRWLRKQAASERGKTWLLIFDNCDHIADVSPKYIPTTKGSILITSRYQSAKLPDTFTIHIQPFDEEEGMKFMKRLLYQKEDKSLQPEEEKALRVLFDKVDGLPLGIQVLVALMKASMKSGKRPVSRFLKFYEDNSRKLLIRAQRAVDYDRDVDRKVGEEHVLDNVWRLSFNSLETGALCAMGMFSFLAPNDIRVSWFKLTAKELSPSMNRLLVCKDPFELELALQSLNDAALINKNNAYDAQDAASDSEDDATSESSVVDSDLSKISVHRLVQEAFIYSRSAQDRQEFFDAAVHVVYEAFPRQANGETLAGQSDQCSELISHGMALADRFMEFAPGSLQAPLKPSKELGMLLKSCIWHLYENGNFTTSLRLLDIAYLACADKTSELYADLQFKAGSIYMDQNDLINCRLTFEDARILYENAAAAGSADADHSLTWLLHSLGNLEVAQGNLDLGLDLYAQADQKRKLETTQNPWREALTRMTAGRAHFLKGEYDIALSMYNVAASIFEMNSLWMAFLKYAYGNLELARGNFTVAKEYYTDSEACWKASAEFHLGLAACYYKLAILEMRQGRNQEALIYLHDALTIAEFGHAQGDRARILWKQAEIMEAEGRLQKAEDDKKLARQIRAKIPGQKAQAVEERESDWNSLVCIFWR